MLAKSLVPALVGTALSGPPAAAASRPRAPATPPPSSATVLTGDRVTVEATGSGCGRARIEPATANAVIRQSCGPDGHLHVIPARVAAQLGPVLDPALFDITTLIADGYDDALPVIMRFPAAKAAALPDTLVQRKALPSIGAVAGRLSRSKASFLAPGPAFVAGGGKVWLDRKVRATALDSATRLDGNLRQVAAPQAWAACFTDAVTKLAVLDTGADFTHPDLVGQVAEKADFSTDGGNVVGHFGHGTHVAATIAGSGAGAGGARRGVAPGTRLLIGKVLDDQGGGEESQVIAGMEWAAARADVVNMSLGGNPPASRVPNLTGQNT